MDSKTERCFCGNELVSLTELTIGMCMKCVKTLKQKHLELRKKLEETTALCDKQADENKNLRLYKKAMMSLHKAEKEGKLACDRDVGLDENPYVLELDEHIMWESGWHVVDQERTEAKMRAVISWAVIVLFSVNELSLSGGDAVGDEISDRIKLVIDKLSQFIEEDVDLR